MNKKTGCFLLLLGLYSIANAQLMVRGVVCDVDTKKSIPYPIVTVKNKQLGVLGDTQGSFTLQHELLTPSDSVEITCMGYQTLQVAAADLGTEPKTLYTAIAPFEIGSVTVSPRTKEYNIGLTGKGMTYTPMYVQKELKATDYKGREFGTTLRAKHACWVKDLNLHIAVNKYDSVKFRLLFYRIENDRPSELAVNQEIIFEIKGKQTGWFALDLSPYGIQLDKDEQIAVTLMTLNETTRHEFWIGSTPLGGGGLLRRDAVGGEWNRSGGGISLYVNATY